MKRLTDCPAEDLTGEFTVIGSHSHPNYAVAAMHTVRGTFVHLMHEFDTVEEARAFHLSRKAA